MVVEREYKKTELGLIPNDWELKTLGEVGEVKMCRRIFNNETSLSESIPFFKIGTFGKEPDAYISREKYENYRKIFSFPRKGDILISAAGTIGRTLVYNGEDAYYQDSNIIWIENDFSLVSNEFLYYIYQVVKYNTEGGTIQRLYNSILKAAKFTCPTKSEQTAIATALSDMDGLIAQTEKLIEKKKAIKQGVMQELLRPKEGRVVKWLGEVAEITMGQSPSSAFYNTQGIGLPLIQGNADIENRKTIIRVYTSSITKKGKHGDIIMSVRAPVGEVSKATFECCLGRGVCSIRAKNDYLYHYLVYYEKSWAKYSTGSTFDSVNSLQIKALEIPMPEDEANQIVIATTLSDMDDEIMLLEGNLEKYKLLKQGMMQALLTGKIRLI